MTNPQNELPLCASRFIQTVTAVRGEGAALQLLRESLSLRASARLLFAPDINCYFVELDDVDRWENRKVGMLDAMATMPFKAADIMKAEIRSWRVLDYAHIIDPVVLQTLVELSVINSDNVDYCAVEARAALHKRMWNT